MRGIWHRLADDEGMTLIEIMVSAAIMFIILTGVLGLVLQTTMMGLQAKQKNLMTNALNAYIEWVHGLPFDQVALVDDGGALEQTVQTSGGYTVTITPDVEEVVGNDALKRLNVVITIVDAQGRTATHSTFVTVRDRSQFLTNEVDPATKPIGEFLSLTPPEGAVVWGSVWGDPASPTPLYLDVRAEAIEGRVINSVEIAFSGALKCESADDPPRTAVWLPLERQWSSTAELFAWNTLQTTDVYDEDGNIVGEANLVSDGMRRLRVTITDSAEAVRVLERFFLVDNFAPPKPAATWSNSTATAASVSWAKVLDGDYGADSYEVEWVAQPLSASSASALPFAGGWGTVSRYVWAGAAEYGQPTMQYAVGVQPITRYAARVQAVSPAPRKLPSGWSDEIMLVSRPLLTGSYVFSRPTNTTARTVSTLSVTPPAFPTSAATTYVWERAVGTGPFTVLAGKTTATITDTYEQTGLKNKNDDYSVVRYRVTVSYAAAGYAAASGSVKSNVITTVTGLADPSTRTYTEGSWEAW